MSKQVAIRRGTTSQQDSFVGTEGEITYDTQTHRLISHDGIKAGGFKAVHEDGDQNINLNLTGNFNIKAKTTTLSEQSNTYTEIIGSSGIFFKKNNSNLILISGNVASLYDNNNVRALDWNNRYAYGIVGDVNIDWLNKQLKSDSSIVIDWASKQAADDNGYLAFDWNNRTLNESSSNTFATINWDSKYLQRIKDFTEAISLDWDNQKCYDQTLVESINWNNRYLKDINGDNCIKWGENKLVTTIGTTLDWQNMTTYDDNVQLSINWQGRKLYAENDYPTISWHYTRLYLYRTPTNIVLDWGNLKLYDSNNINSLQWGARTCYDSSNQTSINWEDRILQNSNGDDVYDWEGGILATSAGQVISLQDYTLTNNTVISLDWNNRILYKSDGTTQSINYNNLLLSGDWKTESLTLYKTILSGTAPATSTSAGIKGQIATSGAFLFVATGTNQWGRVALSNW